MDILLIFIECPTHLGEKWEHIVLTKVAVKIDWRSYPSALTLEARYVAEGYV